MRPLPVVAALLLPLLAGCISLPEDSDAATGQPLPPADERIDGMTAEETKVDTVEPCDSGGGIQLPPGNACAKRVLTVTGRSGVASLPVDLSTVNGAVAIVAGTGDAWSFVAEIHVRALTEDAARKGLDSAWSWSHEESGAHHLRAAPTPASTSPAVDSLGATLVGASYQVVLPAWTTLDVAIATTNGAVAVTGFAMDGLDVETSNGAIAVAGQTPSASLVTDNGGIDAILTPIASGTYAMKTTNGRIALGVPEDRAHGYDASAKTTNGNIDFELSDGDTEETNAPASSTATFKTHGYESRTIQTRIEAETTNGGIDVSPI